MSGLLKQFQESSALYGSNAYYIEDLYEQYLENPQSVAESWREKFAAFSAGTVDTAHSPIVERFATLALVTSGRLARLQVFTEEVVRKQAAVARLINNYRVCGHQIAKNNPLGHSSQMPVELQPAYYGLGEADMDSLFYTPTMYGVDQLPLHKIIAILKEVYCGSIGTEYMHIVSDEIKRWIKIYLEKPKPKLTADKRRELLKQLTAAEGIEKYLHRRYVGQKRFSLEGGECLIPILDCLIQRGGEQQVKEMVLGMAHRGRLNVLINLLGKSPAVLFGEFEGTHVSTSPGVLSGDVKYHMGFSSDIATPGGIVHLALAFNPSHLEIINPVVEGSVKARQDRRGKNSINQVVPILIHGDAAFAGQGIVMETLNMAETTAFHTGGTIHIVINNQIGFTTSNPFEARSTLYCTDVANMIQAPVFHVNGDDPEAVLFIAQLALDYRMTFNKDVVIDLICYRRLGHNEADEPAATQPMMYQKIQHHPSTRQLYAQQLINQQVISEQDVLAMEKDYPRQLEQGCIIPQKVIDTSQAYTKKWQKYFGVPWDVPCDTRVSLDTIQFCDEQMQKLPDGFELHSRVAKVMENRAKMASGQMPIDWGFAENLAYATLLLEQHNLRLTGQDVGRGTFSHRHAILHNQVNGDIHIPLKHLHPQQGRPQIFNSLLSEAGVLGFEYGYSSSEPETQVIWEAQFGDFANGAQVLIDQFISSGETKWGRLSGLIMLLPHGLEGQGPEHSSARLERYLQLCADQNMQVCYPTTPAQIFHLLRRQTLRPYRKPLIIMSPKSLLRHKLAVSSLDALINGQFQPILGEIDAIDPAQVTRLILCAGKVYYDLLEARREAGLTQVAIVRIEQLYPFPNQLFKLEIDKYPQLKEVVWCQEEPKNQGAWYQSNHHFSNNIPATIPLSYCGRMASAAPAVGNFAEHVKQQKQVVSTALYGK